MNPTIGETKKVLGFRNNAEFARFLGLTRQSMTGRIDNAPLPDAWCWRVIKRRPDAFDAEGRLIDVQAASGVRDAA